MSRATKHASELEKVLARAEKMLQRAEALLPAIPRATD